MSRYAHLASFRTQQRSLRRTEPEDPRLADAAKQADAARTTERSREAERLKTDLDARTEAVKTSAKDGSADDVLDATKDRSLIEEARRRAGTMEPEDRVDVELAVARTADADLRAGAAKVGETTDSETMAELDSMSRVAAADLTAATTAVRDIAPSTSLPADVATATEVSETTAEAITGQVGELIAMETLPIATDDGVPTATTGVDRSRAGELGGADPTPPVSVEFDPEHFDLGSAGRDAGDTDHRATLEDFVERADARADQLEIAEQQAAVEAEQTYGAVVTSGAAIDAHMATLEVLTLETGTAGTGGADLDYVLNDTGLTAVLVGISDEAEARLDHEVAMEQTKLAELRADVFRDFSDGVSDAFDDSPLAGGSVTDTPPGPGLAPYADQLDAFTARAEVAAAEFEELTSMRQAFAGYGVELGNDITVLESRLLAAEANYAANQSLGLETTAPPPGLTIDVFDYRLNQGAFDGAVGSLRELSAIQAELAAKRAVLADVQAEVALLDERAEDAEEDLERAEARLDDAQARLDEAIEAAATGEDLPDIDPDAVARADLEELRDDIADIEDQLRDIDGTVTEAEQDADLAEAGAMTQSAITETLAGTDFSLSHVETEFLLVPRPPGAIVVTQVDSGVNDPALRGALDSIEDDLQGRAEAARARAEADLAERRQEEMEAMLEELQEAEAELADEVPPLPEPPDESDTSDSSDTSDVRATEDVDELDDGAPQVTDLDPDADLDLTVVAGATDPGATVSVDDVATSLADVADVEPLVDPAEADAVQMTQGGPSEHDLDLAFGGGAEVSATPVDAGTAAQVQADLEPAPDPAETPPASPGEPSIEPASEVSATAATADLAVADDLAVDATSQVDLASIDSDPIDAADAMTRDLAPTTPVEPSVDTSVDTSLDTSGPALDDLDLG